MKSKLLIAISALSLIFVLPLLAQGQGGGGWGGGQGGGNRDPESWKPRMVDRAMETMDTDDDGELSKEEFMEFATNERYSSWFAEDDAEDEEESDDEDAEASEAEEEEATADESAEDDESEEDALKKLYDAKFAEVDADDDGSITSEELTEAFDVEAYMERMRDRMQQGGGNWQRGQGGQGGGGNWQRPGGGSP
ncbi:MAG: hypothetical protein F4077_06080 [Gammaproteobacteria bacterium]|nr:hypothetical protein [Gammaproteobacteria bacterium]MYI77314.1 hypothetical protein [Gammaproteobacteria bacterium]